MPDPPSQHQLDDDLYYLRTCTHCNWYPPGRRTRVCDDKDVGKVYPKDHTYRVWIKTNTSWSYLGYQVGREPLIVTDP